MIETTTTAVTEQTGPTKNALKKAYTTFRVALLSHLPPRAQRKVGGPTFEYTFKHKDLAGLVFYIEWKPDDCFVLTVDWQGARQRVFIVVPGGDLVEENEARIRDLFVNPRFWGLTEAMKRVKGKVS
jgi:hypothetical protein